MNDNNSVAALPEPVMDDKGNKPESKSRLWIWIASLIILVALIGVGIFFLFRASPGTTAQIRDVFIIVMALVSLVIGVALVILIVQIASLINLIQNEVKPILKSTTDTVNTLKGTTDFLSQNFVDPVIKLNGSLAGLMKLLDLLKIIR
ncbi:MAG TPA: hypothetical protein DDW19_05495 [Anaerolineaceae bacterium]|jgi:flagellar basal body-associated protein FliL|nr:hypothetical protein [Anaerolineaceae bacterium]